MKKSQLRQIIRESIKELMTEQGTPLNSTNQMAFRLQNMSGGINIDGCINMGGGNQNSICCNHANNISSDPSLYASEPLSGFSVYAGNYFDFTNNNYACIDCTSGGTTNNQVNSIHQHAFWAANAAWDCTTDIRDGMNCPVTDMSKLYIYPTMNDCEIRDPLSSLYIGTSPSTPVTPLTPQRQIDLGDPSTIQKDIPPTSGGPFSGTKPPVSGPQAKRMPKSQPIRRKR